MHGSRWGKGALALGGLITTLMLAGSVAAQQPLTLPMTITENRIQGATGQATLTPLGNNQLRVDIRITGLQPNNQHAAHIHTAQGAMCDNNAPVTYPLTNVSVDGSGTGTSTTTVTLAADKPVQANNAYVNVHQMATGGPGVICANVTTSFVVGQAPATAAAAAPRVGTGGPAAADQSTSWTLAAVAAAVLVGSLGVLGLARRTRKTLRAED
jgi:CHRD domain